MRLDLPALPFNTSKNQPSLYEVSEQIGHLLIFEQSVDAPQLAAAQFAALSASHKLGSSI
jgi:hypothetical protein